MMPSFQVVPILRDAVEDLLKLNDADLQLANGKRVVADASPGFPCRVSLQDADPGETLILVHYSHHRADSPYRAGGPIYVRQAAVTADLPANTIPDFLRHRTQSLRGYDRQGMMRGAWVCEGQELEPTLREVFADSAIEYVQVHNAGPGCFMCEIQRVRAQ